MRYLRRLGMIAVQIVWNRGEQRLRALVRLILAAVTLYLLNLLFINIWGWLGLEAGAYGLAPYIRTFFTIALGVALARALLDRQRPAWFGRSALLDRGVGVLIGGLAMTLLFLLERPRVGCGSKRPSSTAPLALRRPTACSCPS